MKFNRRTFIGTATAASTLALGAGRLLAQDAAPVRIGYVASATGRNAAGAGLTTIPNYRLWEQTVNEAGGLEMPDGSRRPLEMIAYDDRSETQEVVRAVERMANQDEVDFILPPWGTGFNLAIAPLMARFGYPHLAGTSIVLDADELVERWPSSFWLLGVSAGYTRALAQTIRDATDAGTINGRVAMLSVADGFGIELVNAAREAFEEMGIEIAMDETYPLGTQDFSTLMTQASNSGADAFVAFSYPPGSFGITRQANLMGYNPGIFYTGVGTAFPAYPQIAEANVEGVMSLGGIDAEAERMVEYRTRHEEMTGGAADYWASPVIYSSLQMLQQAIARQGVDREAVTEELANGTFETVIGDVAFENNQLRDLWYLGQWQGGEFVAVAPGDAEGAAEPIIPKPAWG